MTELGSAEWFAERLTDRSLRGIAIETSALIQSGVLPLGTKLPPIRDLAFVLGVSSGTMSAAWTELRRRKVISGRGRKGSWVTGNRTSPRPARMLSPGNYGEGVLNLSTAGPDVALLPPIAEALRHGAQAEGLHSYSRVRIVKELQDAVQRQWPYRAQAFLVTNGGYNAVYALMHALVSPGSFVAVEDPTAMRLLDIMEYLGVQILPVQCDLEGPLPSSLAAAMTRKPAAFLYQPRAHSVTGRSVSTHRLAELARVLHGTNTLVVEDDGLGSLSQGPATSLGTTFPDRVIHVVSYSKSLGPDLRLAVMSASEKIVEQIQSYRSFSAGWTSRILQSATAWLLNDQSTLDLVAHAQEQYGLRRGMLAAALLRRGIALPDGGEGLSLWVPVQTEQFAMITLAARGIAVLPGSKCSMNQIQHIRVATGSLKDRYDEIAEVIVLAADRAS